MSRFSNGAAYERFMVRWSRAAGAPFLDWVAPPTDARWLDIGCGTGALTQLVLETRSPAAIVAIDAASALVDYARKRSVAQSVDFCVADAVALPFAGRRFDVVASALVLNFIPDRPRALAEMQRVGRVGATVAAYVWDFATGRSPAGPLIQGMRRVGMAASKVPGTEESGREGLQSLFDRAGLDEIVTRSIDISLTYEGFDEYWCSQVSAFTSRGQAISALSDRDRDHLMDEVRAALPVASDGSLTYSARANAVKGRVSPPSCAMAER